VHEGALPRYASHRCTSSLPTFECPHLFEKNLFNGKPFLFVVGTQFCLSIHALWLWETLLHKQKKFFFPVFFSFCIHILLTLVQNSISIRKLLLYTILVNLFPYVSLHFVVSSENDSIISPVVWILKNRVTKYALLGNPSKKYFQKIKFLNGETCIFRYYPFRAVDRNWYPAYSLDHKT
jgi:hypothetical protein